MNKTFLLLAMAVAGQVLMPVSSPALGSFALGNSPVHNTNWPAGAEALANLKSRIGHSDGGAMGGGHSQFYYRGDAEAFMEALTNFAAIHAPMLELVVHDQDFKLSFLAGARNPNADTRVDWIFDIWDSAIWDRLFNGTNGLASGDQRGQPVDPPRLDVYLGGGKVDWAKVTVPTKVRVRDERTAAAGISAADGSVVRVDAVDMETGKPLETAHVIIGTREQANQAVAPPYRKVAEGAGNAAGRVDVVKIPPGQQRILVEAPGYAARVVSEEIIGEHTFKQFTVKLAPTRSVSGTVINGDGKPVMSARVQAVRVTGIDGKNYQMPERPEVVTGAGGRFELNGLPAGHAQIWPSAPCYSFSDHAAIQDVPGANVVLKLSSAGSVQVQLFDPAGKRIYDLQGRKYMVAIESTAGPKAASWGGNTTMKDNGTCEFENVPPGEYRISSRPNSATSPTAREQIINVNPGNPTVVKLVYE